MKKKHGLRCLEPNAMALHICGAVMSLVMLYFFRAFQEDRAAHKAVKVIVVLGAYLWSTFWGVAFGGPCVILTAVLWATRERQNLRLFA